LISELESIGGAPDRRASTAYSERSVGVAGTADNPD